MKKTILKAGRVLSTVLVAVAVVLAILLVGMRLLGFQIFTVLSSSMEPTYKTGSLIYVREADPATIEVGTPITFMLNSNTVATHRVIEIIKDEEKPGEYFFKTKGDANDTADGAPVRPENVLGVPRFSIPYLGFLAVYIQNPPGKYIAITACALIVLFAFIPDLFRDDDEEKEKKEKEANSKE